MPFFLIESVAADSDRKLKFVPSHVDIAVSNDAPSVGYFGFGFDCLERGGIVLDFHDTGGACVIAGADAPVFTFWFGQRFEPEFTGIEESDADPMFHVSRRGLSEIAEIHTEAEFPRIWRAKSESAGFDVQVGAKFMPSGIFRNAHGAASQIQSPEQAAQTKDANQDLKRRETHEFVCGVCHTPLFAQVLFFCLLGAAAVGALIGGADRLSDGLGSRDRRRRWIGGWLFGLGLFGLISGLSGAWLLSRCYPMTQCDG
jgi:hypothetical protein